MSVRPPARVGAPTAPTRIRGVQTVDRYLLALDGVIEMEGAAFEELERDFIAEAKVFALRVGISYDAWLDVGVSTHVLMRAGLGAETDMCTESIVG